MTTTKSLLVAGLVLASLVIAASSRAGNISRIEYLTMNGPTALPGVALAPGTYVFEAVGGHPDLVRVADRATGRVLYAGFTDIIPRPERNKQPLAFGEAAKGEPVPINGVVPRRLPQRSCVQAPLMRRLHEGTAGARYRPSLHTGSLLQRPARTI